MNGTLGPRRVMITALAAFLLAAGAGLAQAPDDWRPDPLTPDLGHPGYDTIATTIALDLDVPNGAIIDGRATIDVSTTAPLDRIGFDLRDGVAVSGVTVDGQPASFRHAAGDLMVDLPAPAPPGANLGIEVAYSGVPGGNPDPYQRGWWANGDSIFILGEPAGAEAWFPVNNDPEDAALWRVELTVPDGVTAVAGGASTPPVSSGGRTTTTWTYDDPVAPYLLAFAAGEFEIVRETGPGGIEITLALPPDLDPAAREALAQIPAMLETFTRLFGPYPGSRFGGVVVDGFGGALETEDLAVFGRASVDPETVAHELAHQWFGNSVRIADWTDIWLNEAFGRYAEILWIEETEGVLARDAALSDLARSVERLTRAGHAVPIASPTADTMFSGVTYNRGALTLHALRGELGDEGFFRLAREWAARYAGSTVTTGDFIALANEIAGRDLESFFAEWLDSPALPEPLFAAG